MGILEEINVAMCPHGVWLDDGPDAFGERTCAKCEQRVTVVLTPALFKTQMNGLASREGFPAPFPEID